MDKNEIASRLREIAADATIAGTGNPTLESVAPSLLGLADEIAGNEEEKPKAKATKK